MRDLPCGKSAYRTSTSYAGYSGSALASFLTGTYYANLPEATTKYLQSVAYPIRSSESSGTATTISAMAGTISAAEAGSGSGNTTCYGSALDYTDAIALDSSTYDSDEYYWTREMKNGSNTYAYAIGTAGTASSKSVTTTGIWIRPTVGVLETQPVVYSSSAGGYVLAADCNAPSLIYLSPAGSSVAYISLNDQQPSCSYTLTWSGDYGTDISHYFVFRSEGSSGVWAHFATVTTSSTTASCTVTGPPKGHASYLYAVMAVSADGISSDLSSLAYIYTRASNVWVYRDDGWYLTKVSCYHDGSWKDLQGFNCYTGDTTQGDNGWVIAGS